VSAVFSHDQHLELREKNAPRSIAFHYWPSNGVLGTQFALGVFMSLALINYEPEYSTPVLLKALGPEFGQSFAKAIYRALAKQQGRPGLDAAELMARREERRQKAEALLR